MALFSRDTRIRAEEVQLRCCRSMTGDGRYRLNVEMSDYARYIALDRLRGANPGLSPQALMGIHLERIMGGTLPGK